MLDTDEVIRRRAAANKVFDDALVYSQATGTAMSVSARLRPLILGKDDPKHQVLYSPDLDGAVTAVFSGMPRVPLLHAVMLMTRKSPLIMKTSIFHALIANTPTSSFKDFRFVNRLFNAIAYPGTMRVSSKILLPVVEIVPSHLVLGGVPRVYDDDRWEPVAESFADFLIEECYQMGTLRENRKRLYAALKYLVDADPKNCSRINVIQRVLYEAAGAGTALDMIVRFERYDRRATKGLPIANVVIPLLEYRASDPVDSNGNPVQYSLLQGPLQHSGGVPLLALAVFSMSLPVISGVYQALTPDERAIPFIDGQSTSEWLAGYDPSWAREAENAQTLTLAKRLVMGFSTMGPKGAA